MEIDDVYKIPFKEWRDGQKEITDRIVELYDSDFPVVLLEAPTGSGKSAVAIAVANKLGLDWWYVTKTINLQSQVESDFEADTLMGRSNYNCQKFIGLDASECPYTHSTMNCPLVDEGGCDYIEARRNAVEGGSVVFNYQMFMAMLNYTDLFGTGDFAILDEAHNLEQQLMNFVSSYFNLFDFSMMGVDFPEEKSPDEIVKDIKDSYHHVTDKLEEAQDEVSISVGEGCVSNDDYDLVEKAGKYQTLKRKIEFLSRYWNDTWVFQRKYVEDEATRSWIKFKPVVVSDFINKVMHTDKVLMMSATIGNKNQFCNDLGMKPKLVPKIEAGSNFEKERRPAVYKPACRMGKDDLDERKLLDKIDDILKVEIDNGHSGKGVIHTVSYDVRGMITSGSKYMSEMLTHSSDNRIERLSEFKNRNSGVFVSPSMSEGVDFPHEDCRWQIIVKVPFLYLGDDQVKKRMSLDHQWYTQQTINALVQTYGRGMRAEDDWCVTYIIDGNFGWLVKRYEELFPPWFLEAVTNDRPNMNFEEA